MRSTSSTFALKPYLEAIKSHCQHLSHADLCDVIGELAQNVPPKERAEFLEHLSVHSRKDLVPADVERDHELLERINALREEIAARQEAIEDGSYYDGNYDDYSEEEPDALSDEQRQDVQALFAEADRLFLSNVLSLAGQGYERLFDMFRPDSAEEGDTAFQSSLSAYDAGINWRETRARYARCIYETVEPAERVAHTLYALHLNANLTMSRYSPHEGNYPSLRDVFDARLGDLPDWNTFLEACQRALTNYTNQRELLLFLETLHWREGVEGVAREVRKRPTPLGYLFWLEQLSASQDWNQIGQVAGEALRNMPASSLRAQAAEILRMAGQQSSDPALVLQGQREQFLSTPNNETLAMLLTEANRQDRRRAELDQAARFLATLPQARELNVKVLLMSGQIDEAVQLVDQEQALGWSSGGSGSGILFAGLLATLTQADVRGVTIQTLLRRYAGSRSYSPQIFSQQSAPEPESTPIIVQEILRGVKEVPVDDQQRQAWYNMAANMGQARIDGIVANQHRNAYGRAAEVLGALMEVQLIRGEVEMARSLLDVYRNQKYRRHSAFRSDVDRVLQQSPILRPFYSRTRK